MSMLQVRNLSPETHQALRVQAVQAGQSLSEYVAARLEEIVRMPTLADLYARIDHLEPLADNVGAAEWLRQERDSRS